MSQLRVVLLGILGHGKTFLFNKIALTNEPASFGGESNTKQIVIGQAAYGQFEIVDTPGFEALEDKLLHAAGVIAALAQGDVNRILIVVKCERTDIMINNLKKIIAPIQRYQDLITIIVSHWDQQQQSIIEKYKILEYQQKQELQAKEQIESAMQKHFKVCSFIYTTKNNEPKYITQLITDIILKSRFAQIKLLESEIYSQFDLLNLDVAYQTELDKSITKIKNGFRKIQISFLKFIESLKLDDPNLIDKLHCLSLGIKDIANEFVEKFEKQYGDYMNEIYDKDGVNVRYLYHIYLKKELRLDIEKVIQKTQEKMKQSQNHCYNWIRQCPYCGLVWIKVIGCDTETTCGNRVNSSFDKLLWQNYNDNSYKLIVKNDSVDFDFEIEQEKRDKNKLAIIQNQNIVWILYDSLNNDVLLNNIFSQSNKHFFLKRIIRQYLYDNFENQSFSDLETNMNEAQLQIMINDIKMLINQENNQQNSFGCGRIIVWKDLPPLSGSLLKELLTQELIDYFNDQKQLLQDEANDIAKEMEKAYKDLVNQAINEQMKNIRVIPKQQSQILNLNNIEQQENEQYDGKIQQNYQNLVVKTKEKQINIKRKYSIKMMTDTNLFSDDETIDTKRIEQLKTQ
ncbi:unnamed protein product [Paramecium sonneborni]|uniref:G domain-containing protein n=1 Tax=Paramecium sonneborni TaxID=65129 RepID=A0A8S1P2Z7_9CILI|nr:unnamed protein product [Paramecium sonneborni]